MRKFVLTIALASIAFLCCSCRPPAIIDPIRTSLDSLPPAPLIQGSKELVGSWWTPEDRKNVFLNISGSGELVLLEEGNVQVYYGAIRTDVLTICMWGDDSYMLYEHQLKVLDKNRFTVIGGDPLFDADLNEVWRRVKIRPVITGWAP